MVQGRYCHVCGQENVVPKETFWHLVTHFVYDITHFDGKFFSSVKYLLLRPGFLSREYMRGRRNSYLNPIRMYVFTSAFFFVFFFWIFKPTNALLLDGKKATPTEIKSQLQSERAKLEKNLADTLINESVKSSFRLKLEEVNEDLAILSRDSTNLDSLNLFDAIPLATSRDGQQLRDAAQYDSLQKTLPPEKQDSWLARKVTYKEIELRKKYGGNWQGMMAAAFDKFIHYFPQIFFISLPLFALVLQLLYARRKQYYYADHGIFAVHLYCAMFMIIFVQMSLSRIKDMQHYDWVSYIMVAVFAYMFWYIYKALHNFYRQGRGKTLLKYFLLFLLSGLVMSMLFVTYFIFSILTI
jgi:ABC-type multidrug transport system fused ATPase/permease subunit